MEAKRKWKAKTPRTFLGNWAGNGNVNDFKSEHYKTFHLPEKSKLIKSLLLKRDLLSYPLNFPEHIYFTLILLIQAIVCPNKTRFSTQNPISLSWDRDIYIFFIKQPAVGNLRLFLSF